MRWQADPLVVIDGLTMRFGGLTAVSALSFAVGRSDITALIGPNGAGKTTVFNCITGFYRPSAGRITLRPDGGQGPIDLERLADYEIAGHAHVARTFQNIRLFSGMTVLENLMVAQHRALMRASGWSILGLLGVGPVGSGVHIDQAVEDGAALSGQDALVDLAAGRVRLGVLDAHVVVDMLAAIEDIEPIEGGLGPLAVEDGGEIVAHQSAA